LFAFDVFYQEGLSTQSCVVFPAFISLSMYSAKLSHQRLFSSPTEAYPGIEYRPLSKILCVCPSKILHNYCIYSLLGLTLKTMLMQNFGRTNKKYGGIFESGLLDRWTQAWLPVQQHSYLQSHNNNMPTLQTNIIIG